MIGIEHCFNYIFTQTPIKVLERRGFSVQHLTDDNGTAKEIIYFDSTNNKLPKPYLEFDIITDEDFFQKTQNRVHGTNKHQNLNELFRPGIGFYSTQDLDINKAPKNLIPHITCEQINEIKHNPTMPHANGCYQIAGIYLRLNADSLTLFTQWCKKTINQETNALELDDNSKFYLATKEDELYLHYDLKKEFPFWAVVLKCHNLDHFISIAKPDKIFNFKNQKSALIKENFSNWDIIVI